ncbi:MAG: CPBP family intramembrane metalloprotease [Candidatus Omnitrophica bacterium]|nr:CPBP family intramembrane metalloprotease [Candidatus Omnitrophota bacterium]
MERLKWFIKGLRRFATSEPLYVWMVVFVIMVNLIVFIANYGRTPEPQELGDPTSKAQMLIEGKEELESIIGEDKNAAFTLSLVAIGMILFLFLGIILDLIILIRRNASKDLLERTLFFGSVNWSVWDALKVMILFVFFGYVIAITETFIITPLFPCVKANKGIASIVNATILDIIAVSAVLYFVLRCKNKIGDLGLSLKNFFKNIYYGIAGYISVIPVLFMALLLTIILVNIFKYKPAPQPVMEVFLEEEKTAVLTYMTFFVAVLGPVMEEIFFRGFLYNAIKKEAGIKSAVFISAVLFSFLHAHAVGFLPILVLGVFLAYLYEKTGSLVPSITVHVAHNLIMVFFVFLIKGINV